MQKQTFIELLLLPFDSLAKVGYPLTIPDDVGKLEWVDNLVFCTTPQKLGKLLLNTHPCRPLQTHTETLIAPGKGSLRTHS